MITLEAALKIIDSNFKTLSVFESVSLNDSVGRILSEDVYSDIDMPPFDKSAMDGYACRREDLQLPMEWIELIPAGTEPTKHLEKGQCAKIMTGAKVPVGANCVVMVEDTIVNSKGEIIFEGTKTQTNICTQGEDIKKGELVLENGTYITPQILAVLASVGKSTVLVNCKPNVGFFCTGSELVEPDQFPDGVSIRNSNSSQLIAQIDAAGAIPNYHGIMSDNRAEISSKIDDLLQANNIVIITGGASVGDFDFIPQILEESGFTLHFQAVSIQPGKPVLYATHRDKHIFGLSGNPVSSFLQFELLVKPLIANLSGSTSKLQTIQTIAGEDFTRKNTGRTFFLPVVLNTEGQVIKTEYHGSAHIAGLKDIFGFAILQQGVSKIIKGEIVHVRPL
jgi:molybdopterin molybdotransferase